MVLGCTKGALDWILGKNILIGMFVKHWNSLLREKLKSPCLEVFKRCVEVTL